VLQYQFEGKNALITGSSKGIGRAAALAMAKGGANVALNCSGSRDLAEAAAEEIRALGRKAIVIVCDVSDQQAVDDMIAQTASELGSLDLFVSNAVYSDRELLVQADMDGFRRTIEVSMWGALHGVRAAAKQMLTQASRGRITVVSSPHALIPFPTAMAYNMAKAAIDHMARTAAIELVREGIRVNVFHPGWIDTPGERKFFTEDQLAQGAASLPMNRMGTPDEMAHGICFTLSDEAEYMTGSTLTMDGGVGLPWWSRRSEGGQ